MNEQENRSGSRWEPSDAATTPDPAAETNSTPSSPPGQPARPGPSRRERLRALPRALLPRGRAALAAAGVGPVLAGGLGGFALGASSGVDDLGRVAPPGDLRPGDAEADERGFPGPPPGFGEAPDDLDGDRRGDDGYRYDPQDGSDDSSGADTGLPT